MKITLEVPLRHVLQYYHSLHGGIVIINVVTHQISDVSDSLALPQ